MRAGRYPFTAIVGQERVKLAIILNLIAPEIGGVLLSGQKGCAKSTIVRSIESLEDERRLTTLPLNATEDRLIGSVNLELAIRRGKVQYEPGILDQANEGILYIDEVNLLSPSLANLILDTCASGHFKVEREGISMVRPSSFILIASMNPEEGGIRPQLLDRFGFFVSVQGSIKLEERLEVMKRRLDYDSDPMGFAADYKLQNESMARQIKEAREKFTHTQVPDSIAKLIAKMCQESWTAGHRADLAITAGARAHAAMKKRQEVTVEDVNVVSAFVLAHRIRTQAESSPKNPKGGEEPDSALHENNGGIPQNHSIEMPESLDPKIGPNDQNYDDLETEIFEVEESFHACDVLGELVGQRLSLQGVGRRHKTRINTAKGRYVKFRQPKGKIQDVAVDASLRVAALHQRHRERGNLVVKVESSDLREKVRESRIGNVVLFLVDASGSMGIERRMATAKGAVFSLLKDAYQKRDRVGLMTFRGNDTQMLLEPTRSIDLAFQRLSKIETGGKTPLSLGLKRSVEFMKSRQAQNTNIVPVIVILSDGRGNVSLGKGPLMEEIMETAEAAGKEKITFIVVDTETGYIRLGLAKRMAEILDARYFTLDELKDKHWMEEA